MKAWQGSVSVSKYCGIVSPAYFVFTPTHNHNPNFIHHLFRSQNYISGYQSISKGIRVGQWDLDADKHRSIEVLTPGIDEQDRIVSFLNRETSRIDSLIDKKRRFIALLQERRAATISSIVTAGIKTPTQLQSCGLKSIGMVPSHWAISPIGRALRLARRVVGDDHNNYKLLSLTTKGVIERDTSENFGKFPESFDTYQEVKAGQFVFCLFDIDETPRTVGRSGQNGMITGAYAVFDCVEADYDHYLFYLFLHLDNCKGLKPYYTGLRKTIRPGKFTSIRIPFPPVAEAKAIAQHLDEQTNRIDFLLAKTKRSIEVLKEHRSALITAAVTGRIDVRSIPAKNMEVTA